MKDTGQSDRSMARSLDGFAVCASSICMLHCLALPLLLATLPALATRFDPGEGFHRLVLAFAVPTSGLALFGGWRRHRLLTPALIGITGLCCMASGIFLMPEGRMETLSTVTGSLLLAGAHIGNWRSRRQAGRIRPLRMTGAG